MKLKYGIIDIHCPCVTQDKTQQTTMSSPLVPNAPGPERVFAEGEQPTGFVHFQNLPFLEMVIKFNVQ